MKLSFSQCMIGPGVWTITKKIKWGNKIDGLNPLDENLTSHEIFISTIYFYEIFYMNEFNKQRKNLHLIKLSLYERRKQTFKNVNSYISFNVKLSRLNLFLYETYLQSFKLFIYLPVYEQVHYFDVILYSFLMEHTIYAEVMRFLSYLDSCHRSSQRQLLLRFFFLLIAKFIKQSGPSKEPGKGRGSFL